MQRSLYTDSQLITAIKSNDATQQNWALRQLYMDDVIRLKIRDFIQYYGTNQDEDDLLQEGIILMRRLIREDKFAGNSKVRTYLLGICRNLIRNDLKKVHRIELREVITDADVKNETEAADNFIVLEEQDETVQKRTVLLQGLFERLTEKCREGLNLKYYRDNTMAQIAEARQLKNANQAKKMVDRCRKQLRKLIEQDPNLAAFLKRTL